MTRRPQRRAASADATRVAGGSMLDRAAPLVALLWLFVPSVQYVAAFVRARWLLSPTGDLPRAALMDLTPLYVVLLVVTLLTAALRALRATPGEAAR
ncbi:MAG: hypothetical protein IT208_14290 [Chthonomonadales bacterium]|nr:hypothetical protein [Chthonomonadales bacterium]